MRHGRRPPPIRRSARLVPGSVRTASEPGDDLAQDQLRLAGAREFTVSSTVTRWVLWLPAPAARRPCAR
jgi:hypothetical protein